MLKKVVTSIGVVALLCVVFAAAASGSSSGTGKPVTTLAQLNVVLAKSIKQQKLPSSLIPSIEKLATDNDGIQGSAYLHKNCNPYDVNSEALKPVPCWYGSTSAKRTVVIFGDSFVGNWIPALSDAGKALGFKVAEFSFPGCNTTFVNGGAGPGFDENEVKACDNFHKDLPTSVNALDPMAVIAAAGAISWGTEGNEGYIAGLDTAFNEMSTSTNHPIRILLGTGPHLSEEAPSCLASHPSDINRCNFTYSAGSDFSEVLARDEASVQGAKVNLIPTYQWICFRNTCPDVIGNVEVYADEDHLTIAISEYLSVLLEKALSPLLSTATN